MNEKIKLKHNYTSELELKSLLIRTKNERENKGNKKYNSRINKYIKWHTAISNKKYELPAKRNILKNKIKDTVVRLSEQTAIDAVSYERFGTVILLMIKNILKKPQFSGYTYKDDFYSDAVYKILKYLHNFNHKLISKITGQHVNAFSYISQYIHNSVIFIINTKKKDLEKLRTHITFEHQMNDPNSQYSNQDWYTNEQHKIPEDMVEHTVKTITLQEVKTTLVEEIIALKEEIDRVDRLTIVYPKDYAISFDEYNEFKHLLKSKVTITRAKDDEQTE